MSDALAKIVRLERRVMWRRRLLSLQDGLALAMTIGGIGAASLVLLIRTRAVHIPVWAVIIGALSLASAAALTRWFLTRVRERAAAFLIDESLNLEDRVATSKSIIERGGPGSALEEAVIEDTAELLSGRRAKEIVAFKMRRWYGLSLVSLIALVAALMISPRLLPITEALAEERADIDRASDHLEQTAAEIEQLVPAETETAGLAKEQSELGRAFRRSGATRADSLRKLSALEERIRHRHDKLADTRADEIVSMAERRLDGTLVTLSAAQRKRLVPSESETAAQEEGSSGTPPREPVKESRSKPRSVSRQPSDSTGKAATDSSSTASHDRARSDGDQAKAEDVSAKKQEASEAQNRPQEPASAKGAKIGSVKTAPDVANQTGVSANKTPSGQKPGELKDKEKPDEQKSVEAEKGDQQPSDKPASGLDSLKAPDSLVKQTAKALPKLSEELLKKAAQLRANELSPADIQKLRQAAESLSRDLAQIAQSKDLQQALQEMARQTRPEQIEQVARELGDQEKLKQELESAARLLRENQQAKEIVAGLAGEFARVRNEMRQQQRNEKAGGEQQTGGQSDSQNEQTSARDHTLRRSWSDAGKSPSKLTAAADRRLAGQGRESSLQSNHQPRSGGEYLFLQSKPGVGAARAPYSSAYPQYRREAERSVQRTQVPANLRSVVRKYFDAINPDAKR